VLATYFIFTNKAFQIGTTFLIDPTLGASLGNLYGGLIGTLLSASSIFLLIYTIINQRDEAQKNNLKSNFFKMIDYHNQHLINISLSTPNPKNLQKEEKKAFVTSKIQFKRIVQAIKEISVQEKLQIPPKEGKKAFVTFKIQFKRILETIKEISVQENLQLTDSEILDISYVIFYFGIEGSWTTFITNKLSRYKGFNEELVIKIQNSLIQKDATGGLLKTNQTHLSSYFRNMYNAIKMVDESKILNDFEKYELIKIYRAQLSNPELYVIFFNVLSRFGKKWLQNDFINKYDLIKNIPFEYCDGYDPKHYFPSIKFEEDEY